MTYDVKSMNGRELIGHAAETSKRDEDDTVFREELVRRAKASSITVSEYIERESLKQYFANEGPDKYPSFAPIYEYVLDWVRRDPDSATPYEICCTLCEQTGVVDWLFDETTTTEEDRDLLNSCIHAAIHDALCRAIKIVVAERHPGAVELGRGLINPGPEAG
ncbi:hypothetical protein ACQR0Z_25690 [Bradyrhizobium sp. HKCCYLS3077]|uniref:hypothetical protein n=1 Tax=Bradyrhizobium sp. HKCCYLS3077 TaxID=3420761 RepID=UPI003EBCA046